ncbi:S9 family peptidase, partial [Gleimia europaea]|nr:S9 family peptidase [Gleimia europaea]
MNIELLDEVQGEEALAWVNSHNSRTLSTLGTKRFLDIEEQIKNVLDDPNRIPYASIRGDFAYNFWVDEKNPRGLWRRQPASAYLQGADDWSVLLDIDELAKSEDKAWVFHGASLLFPEYSRALIALSDGGCDADVIREFDVDTCKFVEDGFNLPDSKGECSWITADQILVSRDFGPDTMTDSGYPRQVRLWKRGQDLEDAQIIFEGEKSDVGVFPHF